MPKVKKILALIPARMGSSRFPGKPMYKINGIPMIEHVYRNVFKNKNLTYTYVATCDLEIYNHIKKINGKVIMTSALHERASDRCAEALNKIEKKLKIKFDIIVMIQGDEPMINKKMIDESLKPFEKNKDINVVNLFSKFKDFEEYSNEDTIKVIRDQKNNAIFFGRKLNNNYFNNNKKSFVGKQVCIIPFKRKYLIKFFKLKPSNLEIVESVDMWRFLENGIKVYMQDTNYLSFAVDHPRDVKKVSKYLPKNINV